MAAASKYDPLCDVIADWLQMHKDATKAGTRPEGVDTPKAARHEYLYDAGLYGKPRNGQALWDWFSYIRDPEWPDRDKDGPAVGAFDARVRADAFEFLREWAVVFDPRTRHLWTAQHRANVLRAVANAAQRIVDRA
jgi:hypothetical protein